jgi:hypothetical protein
VRKPLYTLVALAALVAALWSSSLAMRRVVTDAAPLVCSVDTGAVKVHAAARDATPPTPVTAPPRSSARGALEPEASAQSASDTTRPPSAWAAYDPRAERNARYRVESLSRSEVAFTAEELNPSLRVAYAIWIETAAIFTELDERRESYYVPDDGQRHPLQNLPGHHSVACGGANYTFAEGRFPLYDALVRLEDAPRSAPELEAWRSACPMEAALRARSAEALERLGAYR